MLWKGKLKYYSQHHVLMKGGKFMGAYFYSIILFVFSALVHLIHAACISNAVVMAVLLLINFHLNHPLSPHFIPIYPPLSNPPPFNKLFFSLFALLIAFISNRQILNRK
jgi:hypothetical protein